jgi:catalase
VAVRSVIGRVVYHDITSHVLKDSVRDVRGFAMKFYALEGIWDFVVNNISVFFTQDAVKFLDIVLALKPEPHDGVPQGQTAHNNFWTLIVSCLSVCSIFFFLPQF